MPGVAACQAQTHRGTGVCHARLAKPAIVLADALGHKFFIELKMKLCHREAEEFSYLKVKKKHHDHFARMSINPSTDAYTVLSLPSSSQSRLLSKATIREAYRKALLAHHPDKRSGFTGPTANINKSCRIDVITEAYRILSTPELRAQLDKKLLMVSSKFAPPTSYCEEITVNAEIIDLDDMQYSADDQSWSCKCRCGIDKAFIVSCKDLEEDDVVIGQPSELLVACHGCTLWMRICYTVTGE